MNVADYILWRLQNIGATHVFVLPGGGAMHLNDALARSSLTAVPCHHEQACGIAAESHGRVSETFGVAMVTTGPGATNIITPVAGAYIESTPLFVVSGQAKRCDLLRGRPLRQTGVQEVAIVPIVQSITKYAALVEEPLKIAEHMDAAIDAMLEGRRGPVWLDVPLDVQASPLLENYAETHKATTIATATPPNFDMALVLNALRNAKKPLILAGHGVRLAGAAKQFAEVVEALGIPVALTWNALDLLPHAHPLYVGRPGVVALRASNFAVQNCDLLLAIGCRLDAIVTAYNLEGFARNAKRIVVDVDANELVRQPSGVTTIHSDAKIFLQALTSANSPACEIDAWRTRCRSWKERFSVNDGKALESEGAIGHYQFADAISDVLPQNALIATGSSGLAVEAFYTAFRNKPGQRVFLTSGLGAMGYGVPAFVGAALARKTGPLYLIESDGSLQLNVQELATIAAQKIPAVIVIMNNGGYASIRNTQKNYFASRFLGTGPEAGLVMPNLEKVAAAYGFSYASVEGPEQLREKLSRALAGPTPRLVDVRLREFEVLFPKCAAIPRPDGSIVSMPLEDMSPLLSLDDLQAELDTPALAASRAARAQ